MKRTMTQRVAAGVVIATLLAAGCGGDDDDDASGSDVAATTTGDAPGSATATSGPAPEVAAATTTAEGPATAETSPPATGGPADGEPVAVMVTGMLESPAGSYPEAVDGARAAADAINASGGIDGRPIDVLTCNDAFDPNRAAACFQEGIDADVVAFVGGVHPYNDQTLPRAEAAGIPVIGQALTGQAQMTNPVSFPLDSGAPVQFIQLGRSMVELGGPNVVVAHGDPPSSVFNGDFIVRGVEEAGGAVATRVAFGIPATDLAPVANEIVAGNPDAVACACIATDTARLVQALRQAGYDGPFGATENGSPTADLANLGEAAANTYQVSGVRLSTDPAGSAQFVDEFADVDESVKRNANSQLAWAAVHVVADMLGGQADKTSATLLAQLEAADEIDMRGVTLDFDPSAPAPSAEYARVHNPAVYLYQWSGDGKVPASDEPFNPFEPVP